MDEERLWAPWRYDYVANKKTGDQPPVPAPQEWIPGADEDCFLCRAAAAYKHQAEADRDHHLVWSDEHAVAVLNLFPYNNGHTLVSPRRHVAALHELTSEEHLSCMSVLGRLSEVFPRLMNASGFNVGLNLGKTAGAGIPGHLHWHLVPRWDGDQNFMPVTAGTVVIPQALDSLWELLVEALPADS